MRLRRARSSPGLLAARTGLGVIIVSNRTLAEAMQKATQGRQASLAAVQMARTATRPGRPSRTVTSST